MTYAMGNSLQMAIYSRLASDPALESLIDGAIFDAVPQVAPDLFVALGPEDVTDRSDQTGSGARHDLRISVVTSRDGFMAAKAVAAQVSDSLLSAALVMSRGRVVSLRFLKAKARRDEGEDTRRIDLWFRARLDDETS
ncbi:hypothetical protein JANAI62_22760 [Jannaschia pagri]|uniref:DUF3168 domain-containing protein n=1 Tax=Jannaschia pagri TaxID=2829797 RepID=A0ABQ4NML7_9RHOB|nr:MULTISPECIES: DUF3168 domain-containing protein [unclassified Jannaschia]GIT91819.1 hypothetical protein JANAI61_22770 [Jannaschia sp. AI_61]GIT95653.1 hypothetical protein JANAI62_22760 [Jannaschia sp. AI_62]